MSGEVQNAAPAPVPGTPEYDAAMAAKFDSHQSGATANAVDPNATAPKPEKPAEVPEKFWDAENGVVNYAAWSQSTQEAERKLTELSQQRTQAEQEAANKAQAKLDADIQAHNAKTTELEQNLANLKATQAKPEDIAKAEAEVAAHKAAAPKPTTPEQVKGLSPKMAEDFRAAFQANGHKVTDEWYAKFQAIGVDREMVDGYIAGQRAIAEARDARLKAEVGGDDGWNKMSTWAAANLKAEEKVALNNALAGDEASAKLALAGLKQRYEAANGSNPQLLGGGNAPEGGGYETMSDYKAAIRDPRYGKDELYTNAVIAKLSKTTAF